MVLLNALQTWHIRYLLEDKRKTLQTLATELERQEKLERTGAPKSTKVRNDMIDILKFLAAEVGILEPINEKLSNADVLAQFATMFAIPKAGKVNEKGQQLLRLLVDARPANAHTTDLAAFNLFTLQSLLQCVSNVSHSADKSGRWYCVNADLRHYYHQIPLPQHLRNLFRLSCSNSCYRYKSVPMGWYLSPWIAQSLTWTLVLGFEWPSGVGPKDQFTSLPSWIPFRNQEGGIFVLLDNIFVITPDEEVAKYWAKRLKRNAAADRMNVEFKSEVNVTTISREGKETTEFLGIDFAFDHWAVKPKQLKNVLGRGGSVFTYREISSALGEILWDLRVRCQFPLDYADLMKVYSAVTPPQDADWDDATNWSKHLETLHYFYSVTLEQRKCMRLLPWHAHNAVTKMYAVDACGLDHKYFRESLRNYAFAASGAAAAHSAVMPNCHCQPATR